MDFTRTKIQDYEKKLQIEMLELMPKINPGEEATEEQKKQIFNINQDFNVKKIQYFDELMRECGTEVFNTNVFKKVKLSMSEDEIKFEEDKVKKLSNYLKDHAITQLIKNMQKNEGVPTDSASIRDFFHSTGINMRYLGYIAD